MSIASELSRLLQAKSDLATSIENKGVTVPAAATIDGYAALVDQIQQGSTPVLPYDAEISYIQGDGSAYIDTGIFATTLLKCEVEFSIVSGFTFANTSFLFGTHNGTVTPNDRYCLALATTSAVRIPIISAGGFANVTCGTFGTSKHTLSYQFGGVYYDGVRKSTESGTVTLFTKSIYIFARNSSQENQLNITGKSRVYSFKMSDVNCTFRDFIPVRVGTTGYLYDKVSGELFGNANSTGAFTLGPDVT